jgi:pyruvate/2-oxoglutarate dehydrogenase complex dihydrolipoamide acyltransferase (E2) component
VDTDKVNAELPSPVAGTIEKFLVSEGTTVDVGTEIVLVAVAGASASPGDGDEDYLGADVTVVPSETRNFSMVPATGEGSSALTLSCPPRRGARPWPPRRPRP